MSFPKPMSYGTTLPFILDLALMIYFYSPPTVQLIQRCVFIGPMVRMHELRLAGLAKLGFGRKGSVWAHQVCVRPRSQMPTVPSSWHPLHLIASYDSGITTFDTSNAYSNGQSEVIIGKALKEYKIPREDVVIMTKVCPFDCLVG